MSKTDYKIIEKLIFNSKYIEAIEQSKDLLDIAKNPEIYYLKARAELGARHFSKAIEDINAALTIEPKDDYYSLKAQVLMYMGRHRECIEAADEALKLNDKDIGAYAFKGHSYRHLHDNLSAKNIYEVAVVKLKELHRSDIKLDIEKAFLARECREHDHGIRYSNYVIDEYPNFSSGYVHKGFNLLSKYIKCTREKSMEDMEMLKDHAGACFDHALRLYPDDSIALYYKGILAEISGRRDEALEIYHRASDISPEYANAVLALINIHMSEGEHPCETKIAHALNHANKFLEKNPNSEEALLLKVKILNAGDNLIGANDTLDRLREINPDNYYYLYRKAIIETSLGHFDASLHLCDEALIRSPDNIEVLHHKALTLSELGRNNDAAEVLQNIIRMDAKFASAHQTMGYTICEMLCNKTAFEFYYKSQVDAKSFYIMNLLEEGRFHEAEYSFYNNISEENKLAITLLNEAKRQMEVGMNLDADNLLNQALVLNPKYVEALFLLSHIAMHREPTKSQLYAERAMSINADYFESLRAHDKPPYIKILENQALIYHDRAIELEPENALFYGSKALTLQSLEKQEGLHDLLDKASQYISTVFPEMSIPHQTEYEVPREKLRSEMLSQIKSLMLETQNLSAFEREVEARSGVYERISPALSYEHLDPVLEVSSPDSTASSVVSFDHLNSIFEPRDSSIFKSTLSPSSASGSSATPYSPGDNSAQICTLIKVRDKLKDGLKVATDRNASIFKMKEMIESLARCNEDLRVELESLRKTCVTREEVSHAIAHNDELSKHDALLENIEKDEHLFGYYSSFVKTLQKHFTAYLARASGAVEGATFSIPGLDIVPFPPIVEEAVKAFELAIGFVVDTRESNAQIRALKAIPDPSIFLVHTAQRLAAELSFKNAETIRSLKHDAHNPAIGLIHKYFGKVKEWIFENENPTLPMQLGAHDAMKIVSALKTGKITFETLSDDSKMIQALANIVYGELPKHTMIIRTTTEVSIVQEEEHKITHEDIRLITASSTTIHALNSQAKDDAPHIVHHWYDSLRCWCSGSVEGAVVPGVIGAVENAGLHDNHES